MTFVLHLLDLIFYSILGYYNYIQLNVKLVSQITGYTVDALSKSDYANESSDSSLEGLSDKIQATLIENGIKNFEDILNNESEILNIKGIGPKSFEKIKDLAIKNQNG